jgi:hypothetical protein
MCQPSCKVKAHKYIINAIDSIGGTGNCGPAEIITAGRDVIKLKIINS